MTNLYNNWRLRYFSPFVWCNRWLYITITRESSLAAKAVDCKSTTKKHRRFESFLSHLVCFMTHHKFYNVTLQYGGLTPIVYREVYKDRFTPYRYRDIVNSSKTDILVTQKVTFRNWVYAEIVCIIRSDKVI